MLGLRSISLLVLVLPVAATVACASAGREFDTTHVHDVHSGQTKADITAWFGPPVQTATFMRNPKGCVERWIYKHGHSSLGKTTAEALLVDFDSDGSVCDSAYSEVRP